MSTAAEIVIRYGLIKCEVFRRQTRVGDRFNIVVSRLFRNGDAWSESKQFGRDDLLLVAKAVCEAHTWIYRQEQTGHLSDKESRQ